MPLEVGDVILVSWRGLCFNQRIILTHTYKVVTAPDPETSVVHNLSALADALDTGGTQDVTTSYLACLPPQYRLTQVRAQRIYPIRSAYVAKTKDLPGTHEAPATVANDAAALTLRTDYSGRNQIATKHIGPIPDDVSASGLLIAAYKALLVTLGTKLLVTAEFAATGSANPGIYHRATNGFDTCWTAIIGDQSRTQRRRTVGVGE